MFSRLLIDNYRGIDHLSVADFRSINLFVGKNNSGKSSVLEALFLLTAPGNAELPLKTNAFRGLQLAGDYIWRLYFNNFDVDRPIRLSAELVNPNEKRTLVIKPNLSNYVSATRPVKDSTVAIDETTSGFTAATVSIGGLTLQYHLDLPNRGRKTFNAKATVKEKEIQYSRPESYREPLRGVFVNGRTYTSDLDDRFNNIQIRKLIPYVVEVLREIEPRLLSLTLGANGIIFGDIGLSNLIPVNVAGDGLFHILGIMLAIVDSSDGVVFIDEIENGFHYSALDALWRAIYIASRRFNVQVFATSHSLECIRSFNDVGRAIELAPESRLYRLERLNDEITVTNYEPDILAAALDSEWEFR